MSEESSLYTRNRESICRSSLDTASFDPNKKNCNQNEVQMLENTCACIKNNIIKFDKITETQSFTVIHMTLTSPCLCAPKQHFVKVFPVIECTLSSCAVQTNTNNFKDTNFCFILLKMMCSQSIKEPKLSLGTNTTRKSK